MMRNLSTPESRDFWDRMDKMLVGFKPTELLSEYDPSMYDDHALSATLVSTSEEGVLHCKEHSYKCDSRGPVIVPTPPERDLLAVVCDNGQEVGDRVVVNFVGFDPVGYKVSQVLRPEDGYVGIEPGFCILVFGEPKDDLVRCDGSRMEDLRIVRCEERVKNVDKFNFCPECEKAWAMVGK